MSTSIVPPQRRGTEQRASPVNRRRAIEPALVAAVLVGVAVFLAYLPFIRVNPDPHHDGFVLKTAMDVAHGQTLYRDTFDQYGPLFVATNAIAVKIFGGQIIVLRLLCAGMLATAASLVVWAARVFLSPLRASVSVLLWLLLDPTLRGFPFLAWSSIHALFWSAIVLTCLIELTFQKTRRRAMLLATVGGLALAGVTMTRGPTGLATAVGVALALAIRHRYLTRVSVRELVAWLTGFLAPLIAFGLWLVAVDVTREFRQQMISLPRQWYGGYGSQADSFGYLRGEFTNSAIRVAIVAAIVAGAFVVLRGRRPRSKAVGGSIVIIFAVLALTIRDLSMHDLLNVKTLPFELPLAALMGLVAALVACHRRTTRIASTSAAGLDQKLAVETAVPTDVARGVALSTASAIALAGIVQYYPVTDSRHLFWGVALVVTPAVGALCMLGGRAVAWALVAGCCISLAPSMIEKGTASLSLTRRPSPENVRPLTNMLLTDGEWRTWGRDAADLATVLSRHRDAPVVLFGPDALPATLASNLTNADPYFIDWGPVRYPILFGVVSVPVPRNPRAIDRFVERRRPVAWFARGNPELDRFLRRHRYRVLHQPRPDCSDPALLPWSCPVIAVPREWQANV
jgi:hypothetical protein